MNEMARFKKLITVVLVLAMLLGMVNLTALAAESAAGGEQQNNEVAEKPISISERLSELL